MGIVEKIKWNVVVVLLMCILGSVKASAQNDTTLYNDSLFQALIDMKQEGQLLRGMIDSIRTNFGNDSEELDSLWQVINYTDSMNTVQLRGIVLQYGWPGNSLVGSNGSRAAFLILQHSDMDSTIQEEFLPIITQAAKNGECEWQYVAYLTDRILVFKKGEKQKYGTQLRFNEESQLWEPFPIEDPDNVDERRKEIGLFPMEDYLKMYNKTK